ncbi:MAG: hypothetical protein PWP37_1709 [Thermotogota bacterium]|nr:hypothetical protein [Thermotogota bacterium]
MEKKVLFVAYQSPVGSVWPNEVFRTAFGMYGEDIEPAVLFLDEACVTVSKNTKPELLGLFPLTTCHRLIKRYGTPVYVVKEDLERYNVKEMEEIFNPQILSKDELSDFLHQFDLVIFM